MNIIYDPKNIVIKEEIKDQDGNIVIKKQTLKDHLDTCDGCAYCD